MQVRTIDLGTGEMFVAAASGPCRRESIIASFRNRAFGAGPRHRSVMMLPVLISAGLA